MNLGDLVTIDPYWARPYGLVGAKATESTNGWEPEPSRELTLHPGDWTMLVKKFNIQYNPDNIGSAYRCFILLYGEKFWWYQVEATAQRHIVTKDEWDNSV